MVTQTIVIDLVKEFSNLLKINGLTIRKVILFDSYAQGKQHKWSDYDRALIADEFGVDRLQNLSFYADMLLSDKKFTPLEIHSYNTTYFETGDPFINEIKKTGIIVFEDTPQYKAA